MNSPLGFFCSSVSKGGLELNLVKLALWMAGSGQSIVFFLDKKAPINELIDHENIKKVYVGGHRKYLDFRKAGFYKSLFEANKITKVIFRDNKDSDVLYWAKKFYQSLDLYYWQAMQLGLDKKSWYQTKKFNSLTNWICTLNGMKTQVLEKTNIENSKIQVVPLAINTDKLSSSEFTEDDACAFFSLDSKNKYFGVIGRLDPQKGQLFIVEQMVYFSDYHLVLLGDSTVGHKSDYHNSILNKIEELGLSNRVHLKKFTDKIEYFYKAIDVFIMASKAETFGAVTIEAMASGTPVIGTNSGGTPELLEYGTLGSLYEVDDAESFRKELNQLLNSTEKTQTKSSAAQQKAIEQFDYKIIIKIFNELLDLK